MGGSVAGFGDLVDEGGIALGVVAGDKAALLASLAGVAAAATGSDAGRILERLLQREALGSTGFGGGAAIPHARLAPGSGLYVHLARLAEPLDFGAIDGLPVDIVVLLLSPEDAGADHLKALARISRTLRDPARLAAIRAADSVAQVRAAIAVPPEARRAA